jgi:hypothetical protein
MNLRMLKRLEEVGVAETVHGRHVCESPSLPRLFDSFLRLGLTAFGGQALGVLHHIMIRGTI